MTSRATVSTETVENPRATFSADLESLSRPGPNDIDRPVESDAAQTSLHPSQQSHLPRSDSTHHLDGLRGIAALFVFIQHYVGKFDGNVHEHGFGENGRYWAASFPIFRLIFSGGSAAVTMFFVLSGYVLSKSPLTSLRDDQVSKCNASLLSSVIRRPLRLYLPPLVVTFLIALLIHFPTILPPQLWLQPTTTFGEEIRRWLYTMSCFILPIPNGPWGLYSLVIWTIPVEYKGSMLIYLCLWLNGLILHKRSPLAYPIAALCSAILLLELAYWEMACFLFGSALCHLDVYSLDRAFLNRVATRVANFTNTRILRCSTTRLTPTSISTLTLIPLLLTSLYLLSEPAFAGKPEYSSDTPGWATLHSLIPATYTFIFYYRYWHSIGAVLLLYTLQRLSRHSTRFLVSRPLRFLGRVSFMLYLTHELMSGIIHTRLSKMIGNVNKKQPSEWDNWLRIPDLGPKGMNTRFLACVAVLLPICLVVAELATRWIDEPSVRVGKWLVGRVGLERSSKVGAEGGRREMVMVNDVEAALLRGEVDLRETSQELG